MMSAVCDFVVDHLAGNGLTVLVLDESGAEKAGTATAGVKRQYVGCAGKVANAVTFVNATFGAPGGHALVAPGYTCPPSSWPTRPPSTRTGIPTTPRFATKPEPGVALLAECVTASLPVRDVLPTQSTDATVTGARWHHHRTRLT
jgi:SRSO17 transposase